MRDEILMDPLLEKFEKIEREKRQRECEHGSYMDVTSMSDPGRRLLCEQCGYQWVTPGHGWAV